MSQITELCSFNVTAQTFWTKYVFNGTSNTLNPCAELIVAGTSHVPLLYFTIATLFLFQFHLSAQIVLNTIQYITGLKCFIAALTTTVFTVSGIIGYFSSFPISIIYVIEAFFLVFIWSLYTILWITSLFCASWVKRPSLVCSYQLGVFGISLIALQKWLIFGCTSIYTISCLILVGAHVIGTIINILEWYLERKYYYEFLHEDSESVTDYVVLPHGGDENVGCLSKIFFCWTNDLIRKGYKQQLNEVSDLYTLPTCLDNETLEHEFYENAPTLYVDGEEFSITKALFKAFAWPFFGLGVLKLFADMLVFPGPVFLHHLIICLDEEHFKDEGYIYCAIMILAALISSILSCNFNYYIAKMGLKVKTVLSTILYDKLLHVRLSTLSNFSSGQLFNFVSSDTDRIVGFVNSFHAFWSMPLQLAVALYLLYKEVGLAFLSGVIASIVLVPLNKWLTFRIGKLSTKMMHYKDKRAELVSETVRNIRTVKLSNWEKIMYQRIDNLRKKELRYLLYRKYLDAVCVYLWASAPILITVSIFFTFTFIMHEKLTGAKVFTSLALVNILITPLNAFPWVLSSIIEAVVSVRRISSFFSLENIDFRSLYTLTNENENLDANVLLELDHAEFFWPNSISIKDVTLKNRRGTVVGVIGPTGSGKTTFLLGILGETEYRERRIKIKQETVRNGFAYVSQDNWLRRGTLKNNIIDRSEFDSYRYEEVINATALKLDISMLPGGDEYEIGDGGCMLSGGQRARVALARALYQNKDIYLLDDPFASLDFKVGKFVWDEVVIKLLRNRHKLVIVATHRNEFLKNADEVLVLDSCGTVVQQGFPSIVLESPKLFSGSDAMNSGTNNDVETYEQRSTMDEEKQQGRVRLSVYRSYASAVGTLLAISIVIFLLIMQGSKNVSDWWLSRWVSAYSNKTTYLNTNNAFNSSKFDAFVNPVIESRYLQNEHDQKALFGNEWNISMFYLTVYAIIAGANTIFTLIRAFLFAHGGVRAAKNLHNRLLERMLQASVSWWESTPAGRVINRFCADVYLIDDSLPFQFNILLASFFNLFGAITVTLMALPLLAPLIVLLFVTYYLVQRYYRFTTCDVKRLTSVSLSPYFSHLTDTISGLSTIRAFRFTEGFTNDMRNKLTAIIRAQFSSLAATQWLSIRLQMFGVFVLLAVITAAVLQRHLNFINPGIAGLAITYALSVTNLLSTLLTSFVETEKELVSVERVEDYATCAKLELNQSSLLLKSENVKGHIELRNVNMRYGPNLPLALKDISFSIEPGMRVGVVGRTGSGKSTLLHVLLRAYEIESGTILMDGIDTYSIELGSLRSMFGIVTQTPFVLTGTLRENLTLGQKHITLTLSDVLAIPELKALIDKVGGLDVCIGDGRINLSFGEKQVIAICRLLLLRPKVILFDEATAHLDSETHKRMNAVVHEVLPNTTIISLIHRLQDIEIYDWLIQMEAGKIVWQGLPSQFVI
uniref:ABC-type xenobiotic transporter n=1 Tax=Syphacia muris TaxID=451379 RepID=A0A0N5AYX3_9BILA